MVNDRETEEKQSDTRGGKRGRDTVEVVKEEKEVRVGDERNERGKVVVRREEVFESERGRKGKSGREEGNEGGKSGGGGGVEGDNLGVTTYVAE